MCICVALWLINAKGNDRISKNTDRVCNDYDIKRQKNCHVKQHVESSVNECLW